MRDEFAAGVRSGRGSIDDSAPGTYDPRFTHEVCASWAEEAGRHLLGHRLIVLPEQRQNCDPTGDIREGHGAATLHQAARAEQLIATRKLDLRRSSTDRLHGETPPRTEGTAVKQALSRFDIHHGPNIASFGMYSRRSNAERSESTRQRLIKTARRQFIERGYPSTTLAEIVKSSGLTTGALYHHWAGKEGLLADVIHSVYGDLAHRVSSATSPDSSPLDRLLSGGKEFLDLCSDSRVARLLVIDAPAALGYSKWKEIDDRWWLSPTVRLVEQAHVGQISHQAARYMATALLGSLTHLGHEVATSTQPMARVEAVSTYERLVRAVLTGDHGVSDALSPGTGS